MAMAVSLFGFHSDAPLATVVGRADRSTVMLLVVVVVNRSQRQYEAKHGTKGQLV